jgi:hypothetical protein
MPQELNQHGTYYACNVVGKIARALQLVSVAVRGPWTWPWTLAKLHVQREGRTAISWIREADHARTIIVTLEFGRGPCFAGG